jgi:uncharacterized protein (DUF2141 family)
MNPKVCACVFSLVLAACAFAGADTLVVRVSGLSHPGGVVDITVYKNDCHYMKDDSFVASVRMPCPASFVAPAVCVPLVVPPGEYAFVAYHDINSNGTCDVNFIGYPTEPLVFSRPFKIRFRGPRFDEISIVVNKPRDTVTVQLPE